jgi:hypothetical protein
MCGPKFCSMKIMQDVRDYAATLNDPDMSGVNTAKEGMETDVGEVPTDGRLGVRGCGGGEGEQ